MTNKKKIYRKLYKCTYNIIVYNIIIIYGPSERSLGYICLFFEGKIYYSIISKSLNITRLSCAFSNRNKNILRTFSDRTNIGHRV